LVLRNGRKVLDRDEVHLFIVPGQKDIAWFDVPVHNKVADFVKVADFGIAKVLQGENQLMQRLTQAGQLFGSPAYMSPEQCMGKPVDLRSDIYSLGCVLYEAITGKTPFASDNVYETMMRHINTIPPSFSSILHDLPDLGRLEFARALASHQHPKEAAEYFEEVSSLEGIDPHTKYGALMDAGRQLSESGDFKAAVGVFTVAKSMSVEEVGESNHGKAATALKTAQAMIAEPKAGVGAGSTQR
jgi:serine/threonine protein kinase